MPVKLDDTVFVGIRDDIVGIPFKWEIGNEGWREQAVDEIVLKVAERLS